MANAPPMGQTEEFNDIHNWRFNSPPSTLDQPVTDQYRRNYDRIFRKGRANEHTDKSRRNN
jgi:hypothetical protein